MGSFGGDSPGPGYVLATMGGRGGGARSAASTPGYVWVKGLPVAVCPGCGRAGGYHPWRCGVLVRLAAQFLRRRAGPGWRALAESWGAGGDPFAPSREFWRRVGREPDPPDYDAAGGWTPDLLPAAGGMAECDDPAGVTFPGAQPVAVPAALAAVLTPCPVPDYAGGTPFVRPESEPRDGDTSSDPDPDPPVYDVY